MSSGAPYTRAYTVGRTEELMEPPFPSPDSSLPLELFERDWSCLSALARYLSDSPSPCKCSIYLAHTRLTSFCVVTREVYFLWVFPVQFLSRLESFLINYPSNYLASVFIVAFLVSRPFFFEIPDYITDGCCVLPYCFQFERFPCSQLAAPSEGVPGRHCLNCDIAT